MPIDENFSLDAPEGLTDDDINELNRQADELERSAVKAEASAEKIKEAKKAFEGMNMFQIDALGKGEDVNISNIGGYSKEQLSTMVVEILEELEKQKKELKETKKELTEEQKARKELEGKINEVEKGIQKGFGEATGFINNPFGKTKNKALGMLGKAGIWGAVASFVVQMGENIYNEIIDQVKDLYKAGGLLDPRKDMLDQVKEFMPQNDLIDIDQGRIIFATTSGINQLAPDFSNTERKVHGHLKDILRNAGE